MTLTRFVLWHILHYILRAPIATVTKPDAKLERLRRQGVLNPDPQRVRAPWFQSGEFFYPRYLVQPQYAMLPPGRVDGAYTAAVAACS